MDKLKNYSGADMTAKQFNDVYGQLELDYRNEFDEGNIEQQAKEFNNDKLDEAFKRVTPSGR